MNWNGFPSIFQKVQYFHFRHLKTTSHLLRICLNGILKSNKVWPLEGAIYISLWENYRGHPDNELFDHSIFLFRFIFQTITTVIISFHIIWYTLILCYDFVWMYSSWFYVFYMDSEIKFVNQSINQSINVSFMQFCTKIDGFQQKYSQGFENSYNSYERYQLEKFFIFTINQNYTLALRYIGRNCWVYLKEHQQVEQEKERKKEGKIKKKVVLGIKGACLKRWMCNLEDSNWDMNRAALRCYCNTSSRFNLPYFGKQERQDVHRRKNGRNIITTYRFHIFRLWFTF